MSNINTIYNKQREFFFNNNTKPINFRLEQLKKLEKVLRANEKLLFDSIYKDFRKSSFDTYATELALIHDEIKIAVKKINKWTKPKKVRTNLANIPASSFIIPEPFGNCLIIGAWNYPYLLTLTPLIPAIAAGNTVIIKPSELSIHSSAALTEIINNNFDPSFLYVQQGGVTETKELLDLKFDKIFFTGSTKVGKIIMQAAANNLTPVTLELGGKSPVIVLEDANLKMAAKRITWGKFLNGGQTCIAPDYLLVHKSIKNELLEKIVTEVKNNYGENPSQSEAFTNIINLNHFKRLTELIDKEKIYFGGECDEEIFFISPTIMHNVNFLDKIMEDEIFGPILPVIEFENLDDIIKEIKIRPKPLALYIFTKDKNKQNKVLNEISFGGGGINETIMHISNPKLPFGGVGFSGMGSYHGENGFRIFSHYKSIIKKVNWFEPFIKYPPYTNLKRKLIKLFVG